MAFAVFAHSSSPRLTTARPMKFRAIITLTLFSIAGVLRASVVTQVMEFRLFDGGPTTTYTFSPVDPSLGAVVTIRAEVEATRRLDVGVWKTGGREGTVSFTTSMSGSTLMLEGQSATFSTANLSLSQDLPTVTYGAASGWINAFKNDYLNNQEPTAPSGMKGSADTALLSSFSLPLSFDGALDLSYDAGFWSPEDATEWTPLGTWKVDVIGKVTLTYEYNSIPEPATTAVLVGLSAFVFAAAGRRAKKRKSLAAALPTGTSNLN